MRIWTPIYKAQLGASLSRTRSTSSKGIWGVELKARMALKPSDEIPSPGRNCMYLCSTSMVTPDQTAPYLRRRWPGGWESYSPARRRQCMLCAWPSIASRYIDCILRSAFGLAGRRHVHSLMYYHITLLAFIVSDFVATC